MGTADPLKSLAWFWSPTSNTLFLGISSLKYQLAHEVQEAISASTEAACEVFMKQIQPYRAAVIRVDQHCHVLNQNYYLPNGSKHPL